LIIGGQADRRTDRFNELLFAFIFVTIWFRAQISPIHYHFLKNFKNLFFAFISENIRFNS
jgi:hypothetical protein